MKVPFADLGRLHETISEELRQAFEETLRSSAFVGAAASAAFEAEFALAHEAPYAVGCGSGTDALTLALVASGLEGGEEVIVPSMTFVATAEAVVHAGGVPVIADVDPHTLLLTADSVDDVRSERTRAVLPVHLYGHAVHFTTLAQWRCEGLIVVEDAAQAHVLRWRGASVGSEGDVACFSFYPGKNLGALGDGGAVITHEEDVADRLRRIRDHGRKTKYEHEVVGWCSRLDGVQAALLQVKLRHLSTWTNARRQLAGRYAARLDEWLVPWEEGAVHHLLVARVAADDRQRIIDGLTEAGVGTGLHYPVALSSQRSLHPWARTCANAEFAAREVFSLPMDPLMTMDQCDAVCDAFLALHPRPSATVDG